MRDLYRLHCSSVHRPPALYDSLTTKLLFLFGVLVFLARNVRSDTSKRTRARIYLNRWLRAETFDDTVRHSGVYSSESYSFGMWRVARALRNID